VVAAKFEGVGIVSVSPNDVHDFVGDPGLLFSCGICPDCRRGVGERTEVPLRVSWKLPSNSDGGIVRIRIGGPFPVMSIRIFSSDFTEALSAQERQRFKWQPVESVEKSKKKFFEPISLPLARKVMPKGLFREKDRLQPDGFCCKKCGRKEVTAVQGSAGIIAFISEANLPKPLPSCFQFGQVASLVFCMTKSRWSELRGKPGTKRLLSNQVGVVKKGWVNPTPLLETDMKNWWSGK